MNKKLIIKNIGIIGDMEIDIDKPLILFYGEIKSGKTTILNAIRLLFGGSFPDDIIKHGELYAFIHLILSENSSVRREFYVKDGVAASRPIQFIKDGELLKRPVDELKKLANPFLLEQNFFVDKKTVDKSKYLSELFGLDTSDFDSKIKNLDDKNKELRSELKGYGEITLNECDEPQPINDLLEKKEVAEEFNASARELEIETERKKIQLEEVKRQLDELEIKKQVIERWIHENQPIQKIDTVEIDNKIQTYEANKLLYAQYVQSKKRLEEKQAKEKELKENEVLIKGWRLDKLKKLSELNSKVSIPGFEFTEDGSFTYEKTSPDMLSTSQNMELSSKLSGLYPNELKIELIDRGESLGKSIFDYVKKAEDEELSILATIVSEEPAEVPENIGVFVVENGALKK